MEIDLTEAIEKYFLESRMLLQDIEECVLILEDQPDDDESLNRLFRAAHTIKGSAGVLGLEDIERFTHLVESMMEKIRNHETAIDPPLAHLLFQCRDHIARLVDLAEDEISPLPDETVTAGKDLLAKLKERMGLDDSEPVETEEPAAETSEVHSSNEECVASSLYHISLRPHEDLYNYGMDPLSFITYLSKHGEVQQVVPVTYHIPAFSDFNPELCYLGLEISLQSGDDRETIESVFEFLTDCCDIVILEPNAPIRHWAAFLDALPEDSQQLQELFVEIGTLSLDELEKACAPEKEIAALDMSVSDKTEDSTPETATIPVAVAAIAKKKTKKPSRKKAKRKAIMVETERLDDMVNMVGELVVATAAINQHAEHHQDDIGLRETADLVARLVEEIRETTMRIRMVPIGATFSSFQRFIRDMCFESGKKIDLIIKGADTELDKTLIEKIGDPLMHLIRNSADHGIEAPEDRLAIGKQETGIIHLTAAQEGGAIVINIDDDGNGLNRDRILAKAIEVGMADPDNPPSDEALFDLIFEPGFSTVSEVTKLSGRGVGMDVVRKNIEALRGTIRLKTVEGKGTSFSIILPLSLAIIDGFMIGIGDAKYIIPLDMVVECIPFNVQEQQRKERRRYTSLRGEILPYVILREFLGVGPLEEEYPSIVIIQHDDQKIGVVVDQLYGEMQAVIKPLGAIYKDVKFASGATILGDGSMALILDAAFIINSVDKQ